jgi:hypothetical protein
MGFVLTKLDVEKDNLSSRFRLVNSDENLNVIITYQSFRSILENEGFGSKRIGYIVKLLNKLYPLDVKRLRPTLSERYNDDQLIRYLKFYGFSVKRIDNKLDVHTALKILKERGYEVRGVFNGQPYETTIQHNN